MRCDKSHSSESNTIFILLLQTSPASFKFVIFRVTTETYSKDFSSYFILIILLVLHPSQFSSCFRLLFYELMVHVCSLSISSFSRLLLHWYQMTDSPTFITLSSFFLKCPVVCIIPFFFFFFCSLLVSVLLYILSLPTINRGSYNVLSQ